MRGLMMIGILLPVLTTIPRAAYSQQTGYVERPVADGGRISGRVSFAGPASPPALLKITTDVEVCGQEPQVEEQLVVNEGTGELRNVVVWLNDITAGKGWQADAPAELNQERCRFKPHVLVVRAGETFSVLNSDGILHNFNTRSTENRPINKAQPGMLKRLGAKFDRPEIIAVECDVHSWMGAWIVVAAHPYYAITDENGHFMLEDVPPGTYTLEFWHETLGSQTRQVTVSSEGEVPIDLEYETS